MYVTEGVRPIVRSLFLSLRRPESGTLLVCLSLQNPYRLIPQTYDPGE